MSYGASWPLLLVAGLFTACAVVAGVDDDYFVDGSGGNAGDGTAAGAGNAGAGNAGNGGGGGSVPLGDPCMSSAECMIGECCTNDACLDTCMVPCADVGECPQPAKMQCEHGYCLFACAVDADCLQTEFVCHHTCTACEKKASQGCT